MSVLLARRYRIDATTDLTLASGWTEVKRITDFDPNITPNLEDATSYDTNGISAVEPTMQDATPTLTFLSQIVGVRDPGQLILLGVTGQFGTAARVGLRWYDKNGLTGPDNGSAVVIPQLKRAATGVKNLESITATCGVTDGILNVGIANPGVAPTAPVVLTATPSAQSVGNELILTGSAFTGVTAITVGGVAVGAAGSKFQIISDNLIVAVMPAGSAGSAPIIATNPVGASASFPYTRGA